MKIVDIANSVDLDEAVNNEPPHLNLHCLPSIFEFLIRQGLDKVFFVIFADVNFVVCIFGALMVNHY